MGLLEVFFRIFQYVSKNFQLFEYLYFSKKHVPILIKPSDRILEELSIDYESMDPEVKIFGKNISYLEGEIDWHLDVFSGKRFPLKSSKSINIRGVEDLSAKNVWEINRLQFLPHLALNYKKSQNKEVLASFIKIIKSWDSQNPYLYGINWYSNIEVNIRLINWFIAWEILDVESIITQNSNFREFTEEIWVPLIHKHCKYSYSNPSKFSSANNHLVSEYSGLFIASNKWVFKESSKWNKYSKKGLEKEIVKQHSNGINKEEAAEYIQFITDFFLLPFVVARKLKSDMSFQYEKTLRAILDYIFEFTDVKCNFPKYGDEDDGRVFYLSKCEEFSNFRSLITSALILFNEEKYKIKAGSFDIKNDLLFGNNGRTIFNKITSVRVAQDSKFYKEEGHFIFRRHALDKEIYFHFNAAPLGYLSIAAHGHADALSFQMNVNGYPFFIDSGTYSYHVDKEWRQYFRSTRAHNTICIDGQNQATDAGDTMWLNHYKCIVQNIEQNATFEKVTAKHNGYNSVEHARTVQFNALEKEFEIIDNLKISDGKIHDFYLYFHLHPDITLAVINEYEIRLSHPSGIVVGLYFVESDWKRDILFGNTKPIMGWYSDSFLQKSPTNVISLTKSSGNDFNQRTIITVLKY